MLLTRFEIDYPYSDMELWDAGEDCPAFAWTQRHDDQGFECRPGGVMLAMLWDCNHMVVEVRQDEPLHANPQAMRAIVVPFAVGPSGRVTLTNRFTDAAEFALEPGQYGLLYETWPVAPGSYEALYTRFIFTRQDVDEPQLLVTDEWLKPMYPLLMDTEPYVHEW